MKDIQWKFKLGVQTILLTIQYSRVLGDLDSRKKKIFDTLEPYDKGQAIVLKYHLKQLETLYGKKLLGECVEIAQKLSKEEMPEGFAEHIVGIMAKRKRKVIPDISIRKGIKQKTITKEIPNHRNDSHD